MSTIFRLFTVRTDGSNGVVSSEGGVQWKIMDVQ